MLPGLEHPLLVLEHCIQTNAGLGALRLTTAFATCCNSNIMHHPTQAQLYSATAQCASHIV